MVCSFLVFWHHARQQIDYISCFSPLLLSLFFMPITEVFICLQTKTLNMMPSHIYSFSKSAQNSNLMCYSRVFPFLTITTRLISQHISKTPIPLQKKKYICHLQCFGIYLWSLQLLIF